MLGTYLSFLIKIQTLAICYFCITDISCAACSLIDEAIVSVKWNESGRHSTPQPTDPAGLRCHASKITLCVIDLPQTNKQMVLRVWEQTLLDLASQRYFLYGAFRRRVSCVSTAEKAYFTCSLWGLLLPCKSKRLFNVNDLLQKLQYLFKLFWSLVQTKQLFEHTASTLYLKICL